ncbi:arylamine N-acetyltransferase [Flavimobilis sp. GY10621]|uniref:Arylamine N-acetyltransferase n=1 Tax=Flavimobilis rhizosphaerae TaxID=2775421 RepID=A0ABR9DMK6_9MICO|nr:arylamine N-acetyltransferase [Flavimobilis rhizosphaerae]MBD9698360.1 arylamine N-acetyltransferase [Flavimobilis rhizosphaerae]
MTDTTPDAPAADGWTVGRLDLDAYLDRIGCVRPRTASVDALREIHRAHVASIPFENLDVVLGRRVSLDLDAIEAKLVGARRGGYCYEHALLLGAALTRLGYVVERLLVRTGEPLEHPRPRAHAALRVTINGAPWFADVGYGSGLLEPIPFAEAGSHRQGVWGFEMLRGGDGYLRFRRDAGAGWRTEQTLTDEPIYPVDLAVANEGTSTSPTSPFVQTLHVVRVDEDCERSLHGREHRVVVPGRPVESRTVADDEMGETLRGLGLELTGDEIDALLAFLHAREVAA